MLELANVVGLEKITVDYNSKVIIKFLYVKQIYGNVLNIVSKFYS